MDFAYLELKERLAEIHDLTKVAAVLNWDAQTMMPRAGGEVRAEQLATLHRLAHERLTSDRVAHLLDGLHEEEERLPYDSDEASLIRVTRRDFERARRVPAELRAEMARAASLGQQAWLRARAGSDFLLLQPYLQKNLDLRRRLIDCYEDWDEPYDVLLDLFEPGMRTAEARALLEGLRSGLLPLLERLGRGEPVDESALRGSFPAKGQELLARTVMERLGFEPEWSRLDPTAHPFAMSVSTSDVRVTTRYREDRVDEALLMTIHECGHGLYERGISPELERTPLCRPASLGVHESQSRLWENFLGRSSEFITLIYPDLERVFPDHFDRLPVEDFRRAVNRVEAGPVRVGSDELTYNLHIVMRFELEQELVGGTLDLGDLPEAWNARTWEMLGVEVEDDAHGVLQDVHWAAGSFGYFPTYSLGNILAAQLWEQARAELPALDGPLELADLGELRRWLGERVHRHGRKFTPRETVERAIGAPLDPGVFLRYLESKLSAIYGV